TDSKNAGEFCGKCRACQFIQRKQFPDLHIVEAEDVGGILKVEQIRELQHQLALSPYEGKRRVALLLRFHEANDNAANALLKTLEEPAPKVVMLLTAQSKETLLPTISSRCEILQLRDVSRDQIEEALVERGEGHEKAALLARLAAGRPGWAFHYASNPELLDARTEHLEDLINLIKTDRLERFKHIERLTRAWEQERKRGGKHPRLRALGALEHWVSLWRDAMMLAYDATAEQRNIDRAQDIKMLVNALPPEQISEILGKLEQAKRDLQKNANVRLVMENLMLDLPRIPEG
ncbi:MAG: DNA polymerase III subunit delta' C-terminal domain-containing protein, partial [Chloroflexota bacterium]|nr:DNA polymerase III subunit delta' C-terminal domain-containing protein [Chloroflexota bacterium]